MGEDAGGKVLQVADDRDRAARVAERLEERGLSVETETAPEGAIEALDDDAFDCVFSTYELPDSEGVELIRRLREHHPDQPVVVLADDPAVAREAVSAGATDYVTTKLTREHPDLLAARLETVVEKRRADRALRAERRRSDEFVRLVAHDLRNPMAVARGWVEVLHDEGGEVPYRKAVDAVRRMDDIVDDLETLARSGDEVADDERVELSSVATAAWELVDTREANLHVEYGPEVVADVSMLQQVLENLFVNAVEHGSTSPPSHAQGDADEHGGNELTVRLGTTGGGSTNEASGGSGDEPSETSCGFYVADDGEGIDPENREKLFESGYTTSEGAGLGLTIVERIADAHGWEIDVTESAEGGARFEFTGVELDLPTQVFK